MYDRMHTFSEAQLTRIHDASIHLLRNVGVAFTENEALDVFKAHGFTVDGQTVKMTAAQVRAALATAPAEFRVTARDPEKSVVIGGDHVVFAPGYGAPFINQADGIQRRARMADYEAFCKLVHTSPYVDVNGFLMADPSDMAPATAHLDMLLASVLLSDKAFLGSPISRQGARDCVAMAQMIWGGAEALAKTGAVTVSLVNTLSPLKFSEEMAGALIELARANQACVVASLMMAGASGPVKLGGVLALQNAEILAGVTLAQLVNPGAPVIYGSTSSAMDMQTGGLSIGCPELSVMVAGTNQMARFYNLPSRCGGGLTDAHVPDAQAGAESALALVTAVRTGTNFILHSAGILGSFIAMSFEKFIHDEEMCGYLRKLIAPVDLDDDAIDIEALESVGIGGNYLMHPKTFELCRTEFYRTTLMNRADHMGWSAAGAKRSETVAAEQVEKRLAAYEKPDIDPGLEKDLADYVTRRKQDHQG